MVVYQAQANEANKRKKIRKMDDLDYCIVPLFNETLVFIDRVLYAKVSTLEEAKNCVYRVFRTRRCMY